MVRNSPKLGPIAAATTTLVTKDSIEYANGDELPNIDELPPPPVLPDCCSSVFKAVKASHVGCLAMYPKSLLEEVDVEGKSALHLAAKYGDLRVIEYLLTEASDLLDLESCLKETPLLIAVANGHMGVVERFLQGPLKDSLARAMHRDINGTTSLMAAVARSDNDMALWLLRRFGRQLAMQPNNYRMLPLHIAAARGNLEFIRIVTKYDTKMVNVRDQYGCTPSVYAVQGGSLACVRYLIEKCRADITVLSNKGQSLLHIAALCGHINIVRWFLTRIGSESILWPTYDHANAVHCAAFNGHLEVLKFLLDPWSKKKRKSVLALRDSRGNTPLHLATINNHVHIVEFLLDIGASIKLVNTAGQTPENIAQLRNHVVLLRLLQAHLNSKKAKRVKISKKSGSTSDLVLSSGYGSSATPPNETNGRISRVASPFSHHTLEFSSGYSSNGDPRSDGGRSIISAQIEREREVTELRFMKQRSFEERAVQTDPDPLTEAVKIIEPEEWHGEAIAALREIDNLHE